MRGTNGGTSGDTNGVTNDTNVGITDTNDISDTNDTSDTDDTNVGINGGTNTSFVLASALCIVFIAIK